MDGSVGNTHKHIRIFFLLPLWRELFAFQLQRYEGASTLFGPYTLPIYVQQYAKLAKALADDVKLDRGTEPVDLRSKVMSLLPPIFYDTTVSNYNFGDCIEQPPYSAAWGDTVNAKFVSAAMM